MYNQTAGLSLDRIVQPLECVRRRCLAVSNKRIVVVFCDEPSSFAAIFRCVFMYLCTVSVLKPPHMHTHRNIQEVILPPN